MMEYTEQEKDEYFFFGPYRIKTRVTDDYSYVLIITNPHMHSPRIKMVMN